jgi:prepilin-type N-terminal cleavage/methylation domain-containing protein
MNLRHQYGFTLWELLMTMLVAGILIGIGVPNVMEFQRNSAMTAAANQLLTGLIIARTEAVKRQAPVGVCLSANPTAATPTCSPNGVADSTTLGFIVWVDEKNNNFDANGMHVVTDPTYGNGVVDATELVLMREAPPGGTIKVSANCGNVSYAPNGFTRRPGGLCNPAPHLFLFCDDRGRRLAAGALSSARVVRIDAPGRGQVLTEQTDVDPQIAGTAGTCP